MKHASAEAQGIGSTAARAIAHARQQLFNMVADGGTVNQIEQVDPVEVHLVRGDGEVALYRVTLGAILNLPDPQEATRD